MDRYVNSNIAFQCAKTESFIEKTELKNWILDFEFNYNNLPKPDISFFLHVPFNIVESSLKKERTGSDRDYLNGKTDMHEDSLDLQRKVYEEYLNLLNEQSNFYEIKCFSNDLQWLTPQKIHEAISDKIKMLIEIVK
jgi:dTMP kinase